MKLKTLTFSLYSALCLIQAEKTSAAEAILTEDAEFFDAPEYDGSPRASESVPPVSYSLSIEDKGQEPELESKNPLFVESLEAPNSEQIAKAVERLQRLGIEEPSLEQRTFAATWQSSSDSDVIAGAMLCSPGKYPSPGEIEYRKELARFGLKCVGINNPHGGQLIAALLASPLIAVQELAKLAAEQHLRAEYERVGRTGVPTIVEVQEAARQGNNPVIEVIEEGIRRASVPALGAGDGEQVLASTMLNHARASLGKYTGVIAAVRGGDPHEAGGKCAFPYVNATIPELEEYLRLAFQHLKLQDATLKLEDLYVKLTEILEDLLASPTFPDPKDVNPIFLLLLYENIQLSLNFEKISYSDFILAIRIKSLKTNGIDIGKGKLLLRQYPALDDRQLRAGLTMTWTTTSDRGAVLMPELEQIDAAVSKLSQQRDIPPIDR